MKPTTATILACLALPASATADEVRLDDGRVLVGKVQQKAEVWEVTTHDGVVVVAKEKVTGHRTDAMLRRELADLARSAGDTPFAHLHLAAQARAYGLEAELWRHLDRCLGGPQVGDASAARMPAGADAPLQRRITDFLARLEPELLPRRWRTAATEVRVQRLLEALPRGAGPGRSAAVEELLVREPDADQALRHEARRNVAEHRRIGALAALQRRDLTGNDHFVLRSAVLDPSRAVRDAAAALVPPAEAAAAVRYLAPGLMHDDARLRVRTAEALADVGHADAVRLLVLAGPNAGAALGAADAGVRAHVAFVQQQAYIRDYDVEVAQASFIADPKVGVLQSGSVLDVTVAGVSREVTIVRAYRQALAELTNADPGADPRTWSSWLAALPAAAAAATTGSR
jgi:hypothetical protein